MAQTKRTPKRRRAQLAKSELWLATAVWAERRAADCADEPGCGTIPFDEWNPADPERALANTYGLTGADLAKIWRQIAHELENKAVRAGYDDAWVGVEEDWFDAH